MGLYDKLTAAAHLLYWSIPFDQMSPEMLAGAVSGSSKLVDKEGNEEEIEEFGGENAENEPEIEQNEEQEQQENQEDAQQAQQAGGPIVDAKAFCFPVLVQELIKGAMQNVFYYKHSDEVYRENPRKYMSMLQHADDIRHEPWLIQVGPKFWRNLQGVINQLPGQPMKLQVIAKLSALPFQRLNEFVTRVMDNDPRGLQMLTEIMTPQAQQEEPVDFEAPEEEGYQDNQDDNWWR